MMRHVRQAAVLGAGAMGAQIAAHFANAGIPSLLLDVTREAARQGLERAKVLKPDPFFTPATYALVRTGGFDEDLQAVAQCDWILEAIVERMRSSAPTRRGFPSLRWRRDVRRASGSTSWARTSSIRRDTCDCSR